VATVVAPSSETLISKRGVSFVNTTICYWRTGAEGGFEVSWKEVADSGSYISVSTSADFSSW